MSNFEQKKYDFIFLGTSIICILEAVYHSRSGKSVLMIDEKKDIGGAWTSLEIFGLHDVENAIHYFLPDDNSFEFMKNVLKWEVIISPRKFRVFNFPLIGYLKFKYDGRIGIFIARIRESYLEKSKSIFKDLFKIIKEVFLSNRQPSYYIKGGTPEIISKVSEILKESKVEVIFSEIVNKIYVDKNSKIVELSTNGKKYFSEAIFFTHGSRIHNLSSNLAEFVIQEKNHLRPALHIIIRDESPNHILECIFSYDPEIKYAHDITHITMEAKNLIGKRKVIVLALHPEIRHSNEIISIIVNKLIKVGMIGKSSILEDYFWQDVYLPRLDDKDLEKLKTELEPHVKILKTEDFSKAIGFNARRWETVLKTDVKTEF
jgi:hypothetical protein